MIENPECEALISGGMVENGQLDPANPGAVICPSRAEAVVKCAGCDIDVTIIAEGHPFVGALGVLEAGVDDYLDTHCKARATEPIAPTGQTSRLAPPLDSPCVFRPGVGLVRFRPPAAGDGPIPTGRR